MLGKCFQQQSNMKFAQLRYFLSQNVGGDKRYYVPPCPKVGGDMSSKKTRPLVLMLLQNETNVKSAAQHSIIQYITNHLISSCSSMASIPDGFFSSQCNVQCKFE